MWVTKTTSKDRIHKDNPPRGQTFICILILQLLNHISESFMCARLCIVEYEIFCFQVVSS